MIQVWTITSDNENVRRAVAGGNQTFTASLDQLRVSNEYCTSADEPK